VLQVELAALTYQRSRLVRSWTHLERQRGGAGFMGGPGERQIELDRRRIDDRITALKKELAQVSRTRGLHRTARTRTPYPVIALVGYTNAGKSTLFNRLTGADVMAEDLLFATLDPTMRVVKLPSGRNVILSDTVGFITDLPTTLVAAFRATLEEVLEADLLVHVRAIDHAETEAQKADVEDRPLRARCRRARPAPAPGRGLEQDRRPAARDPRGDPRPGRPEPEHHPRLRQVRRRPRQASGADRGAPQRQRQDHPPRPRPRPGCPDQLAPPAGRVLARKDDEAGVHLDVALPPAALGQLEEKLGR
jgi:hypothetical protein